MTFTEAFVSKNNLQQADCIVLRKKFMGMFDHFAVYLGRHPINNSPLFAANYTDGVQLVKHQELDQFLQVLVPDRIERFTGTNTERINAVKRAISKIGEKGYNLITNNCQHYASFVQYGKKSSAQVEKYSEGMMFGGAATAIIGLVSEDEKAAGWGLVLFALGALAASAANRNTD